MKKQNDKNEKLTFVETLRRLKNAGLENSTAVKPAKKEIDEIEDLGERIEKILNLVKTFKNAPGKMIFFVMYDIENNKVRTHIAKYLVRSGCVRIQKSVYLAQLDKKKFDELHQTLKEVQEIYENNDSIIFVPVATDALTNMKILGQKICLDLVLENKNTLFF